MSEANNPPQPTPGGARPPSTDDVRRKPEGGQKQMGEDDIVDPGPVNDTERRDGGRKPGGMEGEG